MATRSNIAVYDDENKTLTQVYCHFDGYIEGVGKTLFTYYNSLEKAKKLVSYGDISFVKESVKKTKYYSEQIPEDADFIIKDLKIVIKDENDIFSLIKCIEPFFYLWFNGEWYIKTKSGHKKLRDYIFE